MTRPAPVQPAMAVKQTIQARHGVATYVPQGYTIKIINTYGKQVVDTWAFALHAPPEDGDIDKGEKEEAEKAGDGDSVGVEQKAKDVVESGNNAVVGDGKDPEPETHEQSTSMNTANAARETTENVATTAQEAGQDTKDIAKEAADEAERKTEEVANKVEVEADNIAEQTKEAADEGAAEARKTTEKVSDKAEEVTPKKSRWSTYMPSLQRNKSQVKKKEKSAEAAAGEDKTTQSWSSYLGVGSGQKQGSSSNTNSQSKGWSAYIPSGEGFSSYIPSKDSLSAFAGSHYRDPTKSYAEQLFDFSKTPVGAAGISGEYNIDNMHVSQTNIYVSCDRLRLC